MTRLVLASASPARARLLKAADVPFEVLPTPVDESSVKASLAGEGASPRHIAEMLAEMKALRRSSSEPDALVLGADQVLEFEGRCIDKSTTLAEAEALLHRLCGKSHLLISAVVLARDRQLLWRHVETAKLWMREFSRGFLHSYLQAEGEGILGSVGCYRLEDRGVQLFSRIEGDYFTILGLPLIPVIAALRMYGVLES